MKDAYYFSHDSNARNDPKILAMRTVYKSVGYGWFWMIIEILREQADFKLPITKYTFSSLAIQLQCECKEIEKFIHDCINEFVDENGGLLSSDDKYIWSNSLIKRMQIKEDKREAKYAAVKRWNQEQSESNANAEQTDNGSNPKKGKESKENKKERNIIPPDIKEVIAYCQERKNGVNPYKWYNHYEANGWMVGKTRMKNWQAAIRTWEQNDFDKPKNKSDTPKANNYSQESAHCLIKRLKM
jgi:hypothetical protein